MSRANDRRRWQAAGASVRGAAHERSGMPNQDAIQWTGNGSSLVLAVADGHGSARYPRSHIGATIAVKTATQLVHEFVLGQTDVENLSLIKRAAEEWLPHAIVRAWREGVEEHLNANPLSEVELDALRNDTLSQAYGATILTVAVSERFILYLQLGDGEILTVTDQGTVSKPLIKDERLFANETTSLCTAEAWSDFRISFQAITNEHPALILLATDGYPNSFRDQAGFLKVGSDILEMIRTAGLGHVQDSLEGWLLDSTRAGSGDDVTVGILCYPQITQIK
ncbi:MAG TPA: PP2C family serine/threonine-protein phosphatase [Pyrinomonadaceae bacterium]|nr:PP2C family serine/threonine-protein phosphatase [Pyrinomonadaceae bacterium]